MLTKEQYKTTKNLASLHDPNGFEMRSIETIDFLRKIIVILDDATIAVIIEKMDELMELKGGAYDPNSYAKLAKFKDARKELPDWLKQTEEP
jgi:hypothetical protein